MSRNYITLVHVNCIYRRWMSHRCGWIFICSTTRRSQITACFLPFRCIHGCQWGRVGFIWSPQHQFLSDSGAAILAKRRVPRLLHLTRCDHSQIFGCRLFCVSVRLHIQEFILWLIISKCQSQAKTTPLFPRQKWLASEKNGPGQSQSFKLVLLFWAKRKRT